MAQLALLHRTDPTFDPALPSLRRIALGEGAWVDHAPSWIEGSTTLFEHLRDGTTWHASRRRMYDRVVDVPRLTAGLPSDGPGHPILEAIAAVLSRRYEAELSRIGLALYRDGDDSVAFHRDKVLCDRHEAIVAILSLGATRPFALRPHHARGRSIVLRPGWGDLLVMGGTCQRLFEHGVPKVKHAAPRISVMFRDPAVTR